MQKPKSPSRDSRGTIIKLLRVSRQTTRTELASRSGLSKATVSEIAAALLEEGFVHEVGKFQAGRGRSRVLLEFQPMARLVLGAQLDDTSCTVVLADLRAEPRHRAVRPVSGTTPAHFIDAICGCVDELRPTAEAPIVGLGVGVPASVDPSGRRVTVSVPYGWRDISFADEVEARVGLPVVIANRAKVAALGELWQGANPGVDDFVYVFVGGGIVAGIVANGALYFGAAGGAGELGHVTVLPDGPACGCGNNGCLHMLASESAILRTVRARARQADGQTVLTALSGGSLDQISLDVLLEAAAQGDGIVLETLEEAGTYLGLAIANVINLLNPRMVVIGGPVARFGEPLLAAIRREVRRRALWDSLANIDIVLSTLVEEEGAVGAAALFLEHLDDAGTDMVLGQAGEGVSLAARR
ncbi:MAG: ROK family transcriptional regulator [Thermomicrobiales bacterium]